MLGAAIRESNRVRSGLATKAVRGLPSLEVGGRVVISHGIVEVVGGDLSKGVSISTNRSGVGDDRGGMDNRTGSIGGGSMNNRSSVGYNWCSMDYWTGSIGGSSMNNWGSIGRGSVGKDWGSMGNNRGSMGNNRGGMGNNRSCCIRSSSHRSQGSNSRLNLSKSLGVIKLRC